MDGAVLCILKNLGIMHARDLEQAQDPRPVDHPAVSTGNVANRPSDLAAEL
jgi:hypothetical protein